MAGTYIYISETKLRNLAGGAGNSKKLVTTTRDRTLEATATLPGLGEARVEDVRHAEAQTEETARLHRSVAAAEKAIRKPGMAQLDGSGPPVRDSAWFYFHRPLRFGVGEVDDQRAVRAFVMVDHVAIDRALQPALLLHGDPAHVLEPYRNEAAIMAGTRSGSGTGRLFEWLAAHHPGGSGSGAGDPRNASVDARDANAMYGMFTGHLSGTLPHRHVCEGIALASAVLASEHDSIVLASPLFVRVRPLAPPPKPRATQQRRWGGLRRVEKLPEPGT